MTGKSPDREGTFEDAVGRPVSTGPLELSMTRDGGGVDDETLREILRHPNQQIVDPEPRNRPKLFIDENGRPHWRLHETHSAPLRRLPDTLYKVRNDSLSSDGTVIEMYGGTKHASNYSKDFEKNRDRVPSIRLNNPVLRAKNKKGELTKGLRVGDMVRVTRDEIPPRSVRNYFLRKRISDQKEEQGLFRLKTEQQAFCISIDHVKETVNLFVRDPSALEPRLRVDLALSVVNGRQSGFTDFDHFPARSEDRFPITLSWSGDLDGQPSIDAEHGIAVNVRDEVAHAPLARASTRSDGRTPNETDEIWHDETIDDRGGFAATGANALPITMPLSPAERGLEASPNAGMHNGNPAQAGGLPSQQDAASRSLPTSTPQAMVTASPLQPVERDRTTGKRKFIGSEQQEGRKTKISRLQNHPPAPSLGSMQYFDSADDQAFLALAEQVEKDIGKQATIAEHDGHTSSRGGDVVSTVSSPVPSLGSMQYFDSADDQAFLALAEQVEKDIGKQATTTERSPYVPPRDPSEHRADRHRGEFVENPEELPSIPRFPSHPRKELTRTQTRHVPGRQGPYQWSQRDFKVAIKLGAEIGRLESIEEKRLQKEGFTPRNLLEYCDILNSLARSVDYDYSRLDAQVGNKAALKAGSTLQIVARLGAKAKLLEQTEAEGRGEAVIPRAIAASRGTGDEEQLMSHTGPSMQNDARERRESLLVRRLPRQNYDARDRREERKRSRRD